MKIILLILLFTTFCSSAQFSAKNKICWSEKLLEWSDFCGNVPKDRGVGSAECTGEIVFVDSFLKDGVPVIEIACYFIKNESWTIVNDKKSLEHEQLHFDMYELHTRLIRKQFSKLNANKITDFKKYEQIFSQQFLECGKMNDLYDSEVYFNETKQNEWKENISKELESLSDWKITCP